MKIINKENSSISWYFQEKKFKLILNTMGTLFTVSVIKSLLL